MIKNISQDRADTIGNTIARIVQIYSKLECVDSILMRTIKDGFGLENIYIYILNNPNYVTRQSYITNIDEKLNKAISEVPNELAKYFDGYFGYEDATSIIGSRIIGQEKYMPGINWFSLGSDAYLPGTQCYSNYSNLPDYTIMSSEILFDRNNKIRAKKEQLLLDQNYDFSKDICCIQYQPPLSIRSRVKKLSF